MQGLTTTPRQALTADQVIYLLQNSPNLEVTYGAQWLDSTLAFKGDLTEYMVPGSSVQSDITASVHRTFTLAIDSAAPPNYVTDYIKPYMFLTDPDSGLTAQFFLGVYSMASPTIDTSVVPSVLQLTGYDLLYWLNQPVNDSFQALKNTNPIDAVTTLIGEVFATSTIQADPNSATLANDMVWPLGASDPYGGGEVTYLSIINELLKTIGFLPIWVDWNGTFQLRQYTSPLNTPQEYTFDMTQANNIVAVARTSTQDLFDVPNRWRFVLSNWTDAPIEGTSQYTYVDTNPANPGSYNNRGRYVNKNVSVAAADYAHLVTAATLQIELDLQPSEVFQITTSPFPLAWHRDRIFFVDPNIAGITPQLSEYRQLLCTQWTLPLDGGDMSWTLQTVTM